MLPTPAETPPKEAEPGIPERNFYWYMLAIVGISFLAMCVLSMGGQQPRDSRDLYQDGATADGGRTP